MATLYRATGIVLSRHDRREADRWYSAYTREVGKIEFLARGAHKPLAKLAPHLESPGEVDFLLVRGRYYETVAGAHRICAFPSVSQDLGALLLARSALHLVDIATRVHEPDPDLYNLIRAWLNFLDNKIPPLSDLSPERSAYLLGSFTLKLLAHLGYRPELGACLSCKRPIEAARYHWHSLKGGVVCHACAVKNQDEWFAAKNLQDDTLKLLRFALREPFEEQGRPHLPGAVLAEFHEALESLIVCHFPTIPANSIRGACLVS